MTLCILPAELVSIILCYTDPRDIIRWRTVSKWFLAITHDPVIWKVLYVKASFVRPPGPFTSKSTTSLERALVQSTRLAQSWTTPCLRAVSHTEIPFEGKPSGFSRHLNLIDGRWLIVCQSKRRFVLYDTDADGEARVPQIVWEQEEHCQWQIGYWDKYSVVSEEGQSVVYVILSEEHNSPPRLGQWWLIEFSLNSGGSATLRDTITIDIPESFFVPPRIKGGPSPLFYVLCPQLVFDTRSRLFYKFPKFRIALDETRDKIIQREPSVPTIEVMLTNTHVFGFFHYWRGNRKQDMTLIQAFTVPDDQPLGDNRNGVLHLSHEGIMFDKVPSAVIRNSIVDPICGAIGVRFLSLWGSDPPSYPDGPLPRCIDVMLHKPSPVDVSSITVGCHTVLTNENRPRLRRDLDFEYHLFDALGDGHMRGLFTKRHHYAADADTDLHHYNRGAIVKFTFDATQECCMATLSPFFPLPAEWKYFHRMDRSEWDPDCNGMYFDGIRGKLFYGRFEEMKKRVLVVMDVE